MRHRKLVVRLGNHTSLLLFPGCGCGSPERTRKSVSALFIVEFETVGLKFVAESGGCASVAVYDANKRLKLKR